MRLPCSEAAERNREPLLAVLRGLLGEGPTRVLEIGSGTGQHAVYFASALPKVAWQTSDLAGNHGVINAWLTAYGPPNALPPILLDADDYGEPPPAEVIFTANTFHIMRWPTVCLLLEGAGRTLAPGGRLIVYGPFHVGGRATSESNARFDVGLRQRGGGQGVRDRELVCRQADSVGLSLTDCIAMPANNQVVVFERRRD